MREGYLPDSDLFMTVEDALRLITRCTKHSRERLEGDLGWYYELEMITLQDDQSMRVGNPSENLDSTRQRVTAAIASSPLPAIAKTLYICFADFKRLAKFWSVFYDQIEELFEGYGPFGDGPTIYDVKNELGYTIRGAARALANKYPVSENAMIDRIFEAAEQGKLQVKDPQTGLVYIPKNHSYSYERISVPDLNQWLEESGVEYRLHKDAGAHADAATVHAKVELPVNDSRTAEESGAVAGRNAPAIWQAEARRVANRLHLNDKRAGAYSSLSDLADRIAKEFRASGIEGPRVPLTGATILREALQGGRWKRPMS